LAVSLRLIRLGVLVPALLVLAPGQPLADDLGTGKMTVLPHHVIAGSTNTFTFTFTATPRRLVGQTAIDVPVQWTLPQNRNSSGKGYVRLEHGTCGSATAITSVRGRRILIRTACGRGHSFTLTYSNATAARLTADGWVFLTQTRSTAKRGRKAPKFKPLGAKSQPVVVTVGGPAVALVVSAPGVVTTGLTFSLTVRVNDRFGNPAGGYGGTVTFSSSDPKGKMPPPVSFSGQGSRTVAGAALFTPGTQRIYATDGTLKATSAPIVANRP
jgi:hypothetical protein